jgi:sterol desaturase/sphingolipid hydroxylase (fatty acid hydroxylase superfamily)
MTSVNSVQPAHRFVSNRDESCRMFRTDLFERLSHVHPTVPHILYLPVIAVMLWMAASRGLSVGRILEWVAAGFLMWTFTEYVIHRFIFHPPQWIEDDTRRIVGGLEPGTPIMPQMPTWRHKFYFMVHGNHHDFPNDSSRLVMPPSVSIPLAFLFYGLFAATIGTAAPAVFTGFVAGYLAYDTTHYFTHHGATRTAFARYQKKRHFRHHYADSTRDFGVSSPLWDAVWGTLGHSPGDAVDPRRERVA